MDIAKLIREIIDKKVYKEDYDSITFALLFEPVEYDMDPRSSLLTRLQKTKEALTLR